MTTTDWPAWHERYNDPTSGLAQRLLAVQDQIGRALDAAPPGEIRVVSGCAGDGRDLLGVLADHPRRHDVVGRLVEIDPTLADAGRRRAVRSRSERLDVRTGDAALTDNYADVVPADLVLLCGIFGNISDADIERTVEACTALCATGGTVIWTRHRDEPDLVPRICDWFTDRGFDEVFVSRPDVPYGIGAHRFTGVPTPLARGERLFTFFR
jgi:hypothetical protein